MLGLLLLYPHQKPVHHPTFKHGTCIECPKARQPGSLGAAPKFILKMRPHHAGRGMVAVVAEPQQRGAKPQSFDGLWSWSFSEVTILN